MPLFRQSGLFVTVILLAITTTTTAHESKTMTHLFKDVDVQYDVSLAGHGSGAMPSLVTKVSATYAMTPKVSANIGLRHVSRAYTNTGNTVQWSGYTYNASLNLTLTWQISSRLKMMGRLRNGKDDEQAINIGPISAHIRIPKAADVVLEYRF